jgi:hypothetical protein
MKPSFLLLLAFITLLTTVQGCSRIYRFDGTIVDGDGKPIAGASINFYPHDWKRQEFGREDGRSEEDGTFKAGWGSAVGVKYFNIVAAKDGYREHVQLITADAKNLRIVLERLNLALNPVTR